MNLYHYKARFYSPAIGRFLQTDPIGYQDDLNLYAYVGNNPLNLRDPSGLAREKFGGVGDFALGFTPYGLYGDIYGAATGKTLIGGQELSGWERGLGLIPGFSEIAGVVRGAKHLNNFADGGSFVYRGLAKGEDPVNGLVARAPGAGNSEISHVAGKNQTQWISTTKSEAIATEKYGQNGVVKIDLSKVPSNISDVSGGFANGGRMSNWAKRDQEVLIQDFIPPEAITKVR